MSCCGKVDDTETMQDSALEIRSHGDASAVIVPIGKVTVGGGWSSQRNGTTHQCLLFKEKGGNPIVIIEGIAREDEDYSKAPGVVIEKITLNGLEEYLGLGDRIEIEMHQGKYEGSNAQISKVSIVSYRIAGYNDNSLPNQQVDIEIVITTKTDDTIAIRYAREAIVIIGAV